MFVCLTPEVTFDRQTQIIGKTIILFEHLKAKRKHVELSQKCEKRGKRLKCFLFKKWLTYGAKLKVQAG